MRKIWFDEAWEDYIYWQTQDRKTLKRINMLLKDIERGNFDGIGKPEPLKGDMSGFWSRRIEATLNNEYKPGDAGKWHFRVCIILSGSIYFSR